MDDESMRNISLSRMELYDLIGALDVAIANIMIIMKTRLVRMKNFLLMK